MRIGILGSGLMGGKLGTIFAKAGHEVIFSYSRSERKLKRLARDARQHARAGTPRDAALDADAVLLAVHWSRVDDVLKQARDLSGKVIVSCSLPMNADDTKLAVAHSSSGAEALARKVRKANVVSAFSTVPSEVLFDVFGAKRRTRRRPTLLYCWSRSPWRWHNSRTSATKDLRSRTALSVSESRLPATRLSRRAATDHVQGRCRRIVQGDLESRTALRPATPRKASPVR
jgi:8-hydroxy-5-deazaflavin:NADPH oxidoreductase